MIHQDLQEFFQESKNLRPLENEERWSVRQDLVEIENNTEGNVEDLLRSLELGEARALLHVQGPARLYQDLDFFVESKTLRYPGNLQCLNVMHANCWDACGGMFDRTGCAQHRISRREV